jgi:C-terminal processing protease CtpA/Prc
MRRERADFDGRIDGRVDSRIDGRTSAEFRVDDVRPADIGLWFDRGSQDGLVINDIGTGVISRWGFREGDRIYSVNGIRVDDDRDFVRTLFDNRWRDQRVNVVIYRHGRPWTVRVYPSQLVTEYITVAYDPLDDYGLILDDRYDDYVVVWRVRPRSPAYYAGLRAGDVITTFDGRRLTGRDDFVRVIGQGGLDSVRLDISRNRQVRRVDLDLSAATTARGDVRTSLRPDLDAESRVDGRVDGRFDGTLDGRLEGRTDEQFDADDEGRSTLPGRLRGGAAAEATALRKSKFPPVRRQGKFYGLKERAFPRLKAAIMWATN